MDLFFLSLLVIIAGGLAPLFVAKHFTTVKLVGVLGIGTGCLVGLYDAVLKLSQKGPFTASLDYLQTFRCHVGLLELIGFHFSHNKKDYRTNFSTSKENFSNSANFFGLLVGLNSFSQSIIAARRTATGKAGSGLRLAGASPVGKVDI